MNYLRLGVYALALLLGIFFTLRFMVSSAQQCDPPSAPVIQLEEFTGDKVSARYHSRERVNRFFKRSRRA
jgi:hypothetical protein